MFEVPLYRWGFIYLVPDSRLSEEDRHDILREALDMYYEGENERRVKGEYYEGVLFNTKKYQVLGALGGVQFNAELDTEYGKSNMSFLISDRTFGPCPSMN